MQIFTPPALFRQGTAASIRFAFYATLSLVLMLLDSHLKLINDIRSMVAFVTTPFETVVRIPNDAWFATRSYFEERSEIQRLREGLEREKIELAETVSRASQLDMENTRLRAMLEAEKKSSFASVLAEVLYESRQNYSYKLLVNKGWMHGVQMGMPVIDDLGLVGQVVRSTPYKSEIALITDSDQRIPVQVLRNGMRAIAFGGEPSNKLSLRFVSADSDVLVGDELITSGIDGVYPPGYPVARIDSIEHDASSGFIKVTARPTAKTDLHRFFLILKTSPIDLDPSELPSLGSAE